MDIIEACECLCAWYDPPATKRLKRQQTSAKWIRGHMSHIVVIGNMEILMEICSRNGYVLLIISIYWSCTAFAVGIQLHSNPITSLDSIFASFSTY
jgi:hypothetical protein